MIPLTNPDKKSIESIFDKSFDPIYNKAKYIHNNLSTTSVIHRTDTNNLLNITKEGLKIEKSVTPTGATEIIEISKRIKEELKKPEDRYKAIHATFTVNTELTDSKIDELKSKNQVLIEFKIDNDNPEIFVADFEHINRAIFDQIDFNRTKDNNYLYYMELNLYKYWKSFIPLHEYISQNKKYNHPEILIFHDIEPHYLNIITK